MLDIRKILLFVLFFQITVNSYSQKSIDTLFLGKKKYPLVKTKIFHNHNQFSPILLPSEYKEIKNTVSIELRYNFVCDSLIEKFEEDTEYFSEITILKPEKINHPYFDNPTLLRRIEDTLILSEKEFIELIPFIKSNKKKIFFSASTVDRIYNDTITIAKHSYLTNGAILSYWQEHRKHYETEMQKLKTSTFVLRNLYYTRGNATFYLDRIFIIKII